MSNKPGKAGGEPSTSPAEGDLGTAKRAAVNPAAKPATSAGRGASAPATHPPTRAAPSAGDTGKAPAVRASAASTPASPPDQPGESAQGRASSSTGAEEPHWLIRDGVLALLVGAILLLSQLYFEEKANDRQEKRDRALALRSERLENLRFVRERSSEARVERPFAGIDLGGMNLNGLQLLSADFDDAILRDSELLVTDLREASLTQTDLRGADLRGSDLASALFHGTKLDGAKMEAVYLDKVALIDIDLRHTKGLDQRQLSEIDCYENTKFPEHLHAPHAAAPTCEEWGGQ